MREQEGVSRLGLSGFGDRAASALLSAGAFRRLDLPVAVIEDCALVAPERAQTPYVFGVVGGGQPPPGGLGVGPLHHDEIALVVADGAAAEVPGEPPVRIIGEIDAHGDESQPTQFLSAAELGRHVGDGREPGVRAVRAEFVYDGGDPSPILLGAVVGVIHGSLFFRDHRGSVDRAHWFLHE